MTPTKVFYIGRDRGCFKPIIFSSKKFKNDLNGGLIINIKTDEWIGEKFLEMSGLKLKVGEVVKARIEILK